MRAFDRCLIVMFENEFRGTVMRNAFFRELAGAGRDLANYHGAFHPSQTNYLASIAGEVCGVSSDGNLFPPLSQQTVVNQLGTGGVPLTWKAYIEDYPVCAWDPNWASAQVNPRLQPPASTPGTDNPAYYRKHNPFASFRAVQRSPEQWNRIVDYLTLSHDIERGALPDYGWITPNIWNDGHYRCGIQATGDDPDALVEQSACWVRESLLPTVGGPGLTRLPPGTLLVITWDEAAFLHPHHRAFYEGPNQVYTLLLGDMIEPGVDRRPSNHYNLLRTIEHNFGLVDLGKNDRGAARLRFLEGERFAWDVPEPTPFEQATDAALATLGAEPFCVLRTAGGGLSSSAWTERGWASPQELGFSASAAPALAGLPGEEGSGDEGGLMLVFPATDNRELHWSRYSVSHGWSQPASLAVACDGAPVLCAYQDPTSGQSRLMLVYRPAEQPGLASLSWLVEGYGVTTPAWQAHPTLLPFYGARDLALGFLPHSLLLCWNGGPADALATASQNVAAFNAVQAPFPSETTTGLWSARSYPARYYPGDAQAPEPYPLTARGVMAATTLDGELFLFHSGVDTGSKSSPGNGSNPLRVSVFALPGTMTAMHVNGNQYGTLAEAGWGPVEELPGAHTGAGGPLAAAASEGQVWLLFRPPGSARLHVLRGAWQGSANKCRKEGQA